MFDSLSEIAWRATPDLFGYFVSQFSTRRFYLYPHVKLIGQRIARAIVNGNGRIIVNLPPGHGKSSIASHWTPTWLLDNRPDHRVICASHGAELAESWGRIVRDEFRNNQLLQTKLKEDSDAVNRWNTEAGGGMVSIGVGGGVTGFRANAILVDDPHATWEKAYSHIERVKVIEWFEGTLYDRLEPNGTIIVLMHRWHDQDLTGHLISHHADQWDVIRLPALAEPGDPLGRAEGEALCPQRYTRDSLEQSKRANEMVFTAKYQQDPQGIGTDRVYDHFLPTPMPAGNLDKTVELVAGQPLHVSFDFNRNPGMHVEIGQYFFDRDMFTCCHEIHGPFMKLAVSLDELEKLIRRLGGGGEWRNWHWPEIQIFADATGTQDRAETTETALDMIINRMRKLRWPFRMRVPLKNPPQRTRVDSFNDALHDQDGAVHYVANPRCVRLIADMKELRTDEAGLIDKLEAKLSHASDAEGYRVHYIRPVRQAAAQPVKVDRRVLIGR